VTLCPRTGAGQGLVGHPRDDESLGGTTRGSTAVADLAGGESGENPSRCWVCTWRAGGESGESRSGGAITLLPSRRRDPVAHSILVPSVRIIGHVARIPMPGRAAADSRCRCVGTGSTLCSVAHKAARTGAGFCLCTHRANRRRASDGGYGSHRNPGAEPG
jgi:hypothetical protein